MLVWGFAEATGELCTRCPCLAIWGKARQGPGVPKPTCLPQTFHKLGPWWFAGSHRSGEETGRPDKLGPLV